jgi:CubicO group peptidase (beta-lactamase class C family)
MSPSARAPVGLSLLVAGSLLSCGPPAVRPATRAAGPAAVVAAPPPFSVRGDAPPARRREVEAALARCEAGLRPLFPARRPAPLDVIAYAARAEFVRGLERELGFDARTAAYFARSSAPRPLRGKLLVPPDMTAANVCHEFVHHHLEAAIDRGRLLSEKWFDEGTASYLSSAILEPWRIRMVLGYFFSRHHYHPFFVLRSEADWTLLHADSRLRDLAYLEALSLVSRFFARGGERGFREVLDRARSVPLEEAIRAVAGRGPEELFAAWLDETRRRPAAAGGLFDAGAAEPGFLPRARPEEVGLDEAALARLVEGAERSRSDALLVVKDGRLVAERIFFDARGPIELFSVTKAFASLAVGLLVDERKIPSLDAPLSSWIASWRGTPREKITLRHVLTHTSGLEHAAADGVMSREPDVSRYARERPLVLEPGRVFSYSNEASQLLSEVVASAAGLPLDRYLDERLFRPLGIATPRWRHDAAGNVLAYTGLALPARDLARVGLLLARGGLQGGRRILPEAYLREATRPGLPSAPEMGLGFWLRRARGAAKGAREILGYNTNGWQGQLLAVYPRSGLVVVRLRQPIAFTEEENRRFGFFELFGLAERLLAPSR